jgi:hypothetical protein
MSRLRKAFGTRHSWPIRIIRDIIEDLGPEVPVEAVVSWQSTISPFLFS